MIFPCKDKILFCSRRFKGMASVPPITIVIPVYNRAGIVKRTLDSVTRQTFRPLGVVLVDNGSADDTLRVLEEWKRENKDENLSIEILSETRPGACAARNTGLNSVKSRYVMFFDSDDEMSPGHVERAMKMFENNPDADIVGWDVDCISLSGKNRKLIFASGDFLFNHIFHAILSTQRYACRTDLIGRAGGWDETVLGWNDYELGVRMLLLNPKVMYAGPRRTVTVHNQAESITGTGYSVTPSKWEHSLDVCQNNLEKAGQHKAVRWIEVRRAILAGHYRKEGKPDEGRRLMKEIIERTGTPALRMFYRMVYRYVSLGGRGVAILVKLFM